MNLTWLRLFSRVSERNPVKNSYNKAFGRSMAVRPYDLLSLPHGAYSAGSNSEGLLFSGGSYGKSA